MGLFSFLFKRKRKVKLGLALGSGGAKGFAELGVIKAFEENNISFDYIAGTSIGSIIGAFYANGYTSTDIMEMLKKVDASEIKSLLMLQMDTTGLCNVIERELGVYSFDELKKPFKAVATEYYSGSEKVFSSGSVAKSLCASACIPPYFKPIDIDGSLYVDGAFSNSIPSDVVREMGADYIIGVDLSVRDSKPNFLSKILPTYKGKVEKPYQKGYDNSDFMLHPDLSDFSSIAFSSMYEMFDIGYDLAMENMDKIKSEIKNFKFKKRKRQK